MQISILLFFSFIIESISVPAHKNKVFGIDSCIQQAVERESASSEHKHIDANVKATYSAIRTATPSSPRRSTRVSPSEANDRYFCSGTALRTCQVRLCPRA